MPPSSTSSEEKKKFVRRLAKAFGTCTEESRQYGLCLKSYLEGVERGACSAQFEALSRCFKKGLYPYPYPHPYHQPQPESQP